MKIIRNRSRSLKIPKTKKKALKSRNPSPPLTEETESAEEYLQTDSLPAELEETSSLSTAPTGVSYLYPIYKTAGDPAGGIASWSEGNATSYTLVTESDTSWGTADTTTWYVADGTIGIDNSVKVYGNVNLILSDECELTITGPKTSPDYTKAGINVTGTNTLTIYAQSTDGDMGSLTAIGGANGGAGIGSNRVGGTGSGKNITINGGNITATGGYTEGKGGAAGIGGGYNANASNIVINGGIITATGQEKGAGIGASADLSADHIYINGGIITAKAGSKGACIGGNNNDCSSIFVNTVNTISVGESLVSLNKLSNTGGDLASSLKSHRCAIVEPVKCKVTYYRNEGTGSVPEDDNEYLIGDVITLDTETEPTRYGYEFLGWNTDKDAATTITTYTADKEIIKFYAIWGFADTIDIGSQTDLDNALAVYRAAGKDYQVTWNITNNFTVTKKNTFYNKKNVSLTVEGNDCTITASAEDTYIDYAFDLGSYSAAASTFEFNDITFVIGDSFRNGMLVQTRGSASAEVTLYDSFIIMNRTEAPKKAGVAKAGAPIVNNNSTVVLCGNSEITTDEFCWTAADMTPESKKTSLQIQSGDCSFNDNRADVMKLSNPLITFSAGSKQNEVEGYELSNLAPVDKLGTAAGYNSASLVTVDEIPDQAYTGLALTPEVTVRLEGTPLEESCYSVNFSNNTEPGTATVTVTYGNPLFGTYTGTVQSSFNITPAADTDSDRKSTTVTPTGTGSWDSPTYGTWSIDENGKWRFGNQSIRAFSNTWGYVYNPYAGEGQNKTDWFYFDKDGFMLTGLQAIDGKTYYFNEQKDGRLGALLTGWQLINGKWYYFFDRRNSEYGAMAVDTVTPDGFKVGKDGARID